MSIDISPENQRFLDESVASGMFPSQSAAVDEAVTLLRAIKQAGESAQLDAVPLPDVLEECDGYISIRGHRIGLHHIAQEYFAGRNESEIQDTFETLTVKEVSDSIAFIRSNEEAVRSYVRKEERLSEELRKRWPKGPSLEELRARWLAKFGKPFNLSCH